MRVIDLTHKIKGGMPVYPGSPGISLSKSAEIKARGFAETHLTLPSHAGTHVDAPAHMIDGGATLDSLPAHTFAGRAVTVDIRRGTPRNIEEIQLTDVDFIFFLTGHGSSYGTDAYFAGWPGLETGLCIRLAASSVIGVGIDTPSVDASGESFMPCHKALLGAGKIIYENLAALDQTLGGVYTVAALPLHFEDSDGAPARVIAMVSGGGQTHPGRAQWPII